MKKKKILITGALGQDGKILSSILLKKKYDVFGIIKNKPYKEIDKNIKYKKVDLRDNKKLFDYIKKIKPEVIVHLASNNPSYNDSIKSNKFYKDNVFFTKSLIQSAIKSKLKIHFIFGNSSQIFSKKIKLVDEESKFIASNKYNQFRIDILKFLMKKKDNKNFSFTNLILFNHDSKFRNKKFLLPRLIKAVKEKNISFLENIYRENITADFSHAEEICKAIYLLIKKNICIDNLILSSNKKTKVNDLLKYLLTKYNLKIRLQSKVRKNSNYLIGNNKLAVKLLKWNPKKDIYNALDELYKVI